MRLDQDKQMEDLAKFQREMLGPKELAKMTVNHLRSQGFSPEELNTGKQKTEG